MSSVKITMKGKPITAEDLTRDMVNVIVNDVKAKIESAVTPLEAQQITVDIDSSNPSNITFGFKGPEEIINKIRAMMDNNFRRL